MCSLNSEYYQPLAFMAKPSIRNSCMSGPRCCDIKFVPGGWAGCKDGAEAEPKTTSRGPPFHRQMLGIGQRELLIPQHKTPYGKQIAARLDRA